MLAAGLVWSSLCIFETPAFAGQHYLRCDKIQFSSDTQKETAPVTPPITPSFLVTFDLETKAYTFSPKILIGKIVRVNDKSIYFMDRTMSLQSPKWTWKILASLNRATLIFELTYLSTDGAVQAFRHYQCKILASPPKPQL